VRVVDGESVLRDAVEAYRSALGGRLLSAYALGSLAHGGFSELVSDIDLGLIVSDPLDPDDPAKIQAVADAEKAKGSPLRARLSVFWGTPATLRGEQPGGRFPALDRLDLLESGRLLAGSDDARRGLPRPTAHELIVSGAEFAIDYLAGIRSSTAAEGAGLGSMRLATEDAAEEIRAPELLARRGVRRVTKLVLFPVRFLYTAATGKVGTNDAAVDHYLSSRENPSSELVAAARGWRSGAPFEHRTAIALLGEQLVPLYLHYIDDHIARLGALERCDLVKAFEAWRARLVA
jgi:predicted nucleotidyltransferase